MKRKIKIIDKVSGKVIEKEIEIRNQDHFEIQLKNKSHVFKNRKKYTRKLKHKKKGDE